MAAKSTRKRSSGASRKAPARRTKSSGPSPWRWYGAGVASGVLLSFLLYLGVLAPDPRPVPGDVASTESPAAEPPRPRFDFYTELPKERVEVDVDPEEVAKARERPPEEQFLLQAGSFRQREDADRRRAELLLLGLDPTIEQTRSDNGTWYRVYLGPFESKSSLNKARSLTAAQDIDTLLLKQKAG